MWLWSYRIAIPWKMLLALALVLGCVIARCSAAANPAATELPSPAAAGDTLRLSDREAIRDLITRYARAVDTKDWVRYRTCFTPDARIDYVAAGGIAGSVEEVANWLDSMFFVFSATQHMVSNFDFQWDAADPTKCHLVAMFHNPCVLSVAPFLQPLFTVGGWYHHDLVRQPDGTWLSTNLSEEIAYNGVVPNLICFVLVVGYLLLRQVQWLRGT